MKGVNHFAVLFVVFLKLMPAQATASPVVIGFVGDIMLDDGPGEEILKHKKDPFAFVKDQLKHSDFVIGNLECPVAKSGKVYQTKPVTFRANPKALKALENIFDAVGVANNHSGDYGRDAFIETINNAKHSGLKVFGGGENLAQAHQPLWIEKNNLKIAVLGYNDFKPRSFEAGPNWPGIAWSEDDHVVYDIKKAREAGADFVIPFIHWGVEYQPEPDQRQIDLAKKMIDSGADAVVGGHPHVTQKVSFYKDKPLIWSLGNFLFDGFPEGPRRHGWILEMKLERNKSPEIQIYDVHLTARGIPQSAKSIELNKQIFEMKAAQSR